MSSMMEFDIGLQYSGKVKEGRRKEGEGRGGREGGKRVKGEEGEKRGRGRG